MCKQKGERVAPHRATQSKAKKGMTQNYYRNEYTAEQWAALIDKAHELGCAVNWSKYGNIAEIDSTAKESAMMQTAGTRQYWADVIHGLIADAARKRWGVYTEGVEKVRAWFNSEDRAQEYARECESHEGTPHAVRCNF